MGVEEDRIFFEDTLPKVGSKIALLIKSLDQKVRLPVDCVAFDSDFSEEPENGQVFHHNAICCHPARGKQFGCMLTEEDEGGKILRKRGATCEFRIMKGRCGSSELAREIKLLEEEFIW